jgi:hypothetical protein
MRMIGIIGGMSAESTAHYYAEINAGVRKALGGLHSAEILLWSVDFAEIAAMQAQGDWQKAGKLLADIALRLERPVQMPSCWPPTPCTSWRRRLKRRCPFLSFTLPTQRLLPFMRGAASARR